MKVLVVGSVYPRFPEDNEVPWLRKSVATLRDAGVEVEVMAPSYKGLKSHTIDGVPVHRFRYAVKNLEILTHDEGAPTKMAKRNGVTFRYVELSMRNGSETEFTEELDDSL